MFEFVILMVILSILDKIVVGHYTEPEPQHTERVDRRWDFKTVEDCMEYRELRATGWRGDALDFYKWRDED